ncbi:hypothetical protein Taro_022285, partial [Colocasia esculenta]|nr:hypothetical protein [Colocasia esculenta]
GQLDLSSVAARLRGRLVLFVQVKESRKAPVPLLVLVSTIVESSLRHQESNTLTCGASGWMRRGDEEDMAIMLRGITCKEVLESFMRSGRAAQDVQALKGINLQKLAAWTTKEIPKAEDDAKLEKVMKGFVICLAGELLFPSMDNVLEEEQLSAVCGIWEGERLVPAVLAFLYSELTTESLGKPPYGTMLLFTCWIDLHFKFDVNNEAKSSSWIFIKSLLRHMDGLVGLEGRIANGVPQL